ncbi:MAG TPA: DinB family protein, partial [Vicinamibacteria bacterium]|nr:DinB family protein [Vicinamibacteria bacterium]
PLQAMAANARRIEEIARTLGAAGLERSYAPGKWSGKQILAHLADAEIGVSFRTRQALAEEHHTIQPFDEGAWARRYQGVDHEAALRSVLSLRGWNLWLFSGLTPQDLAREAYHPERGPETVGTIIRLLAGHDFNHLAQLETIASGC